MELRQAHYLPRIRHRSDAHSHFHGAIRVRLLNSQGSPSHHQRTLQSFGRLKMKGRYNPPELGLQDVSPDCGHIQVCEI